MLKILLIDDHELLLDSMEIILQELSTELCILKAKSNRVALHYILTEQAISLVMLDLNLAGTSGLTLLKELIKQNPLLPVVMLSGSENPTEMQQCLDNGALGFISKTSSAKIILNAVRLVLAGGLYIPKEMLVKQKEIKQFEINRQLTSRQIEVLKQLILGVSNKEIANTLNCSESTIKTHVTAILKALKVANRTQALIAAQNEGYI